MVKLLVIDSDSRATTTLRAILPDGFSVLEHQLGALSVDAVRRFDPDVVFLAAGLPDAPSTAVLAAISSLPIAPPVVLVATTIKASGIAKTVRAGAFSYLVKPYVRAEVLEVVDEAVTETAHRKAVSAAALDPALSTVIGAAPSMVRLKQHMMRYADSAEPILVLGETGSGKDVVARAMHEISSRRDGPYVPINCGAVPVGLFETEVFGAERGAYTGAVTRAGCFEQANHGTLFLDEIGEMDVQAQVKLLRVLEERHVTRIGGSRRVSIDVRTIAATNRNLRDAISRREFREDLFYRLNVLTLSVPPLRDRVEDIPVLVEAFLRRDAPGTAISTSAIRKLLLHTWPGNVRELRSVLSRAAALCDTRRIKAGDLLFM